MLLQRKLLMNTKRNYVFTIIATFNITSQAFDCPRINSWSTVTRPTRTAGGYILTDGIYVDTYSHRYLEAGVDVIYWNDTAFPTYKPQDITITATGNYETVINPAYGANGDQINHQLRYDRPGNYTINVTIFNKTI